MATKIRFVAKNGLDNANNTITNVANPVNANDAATMGFASNASNLTSGMIADTRIPNLNWYKITTGKPTTLSGYGITDAVSTASRGVANGIATLDASGLIPSTQLPSYVDDVLEYAARASFPVTGEAGKIYVALDTNKTYRWSGSAYVYITSGAVDSVAGKTGVVTLVKADVGLGNVDNTSDINKPVSTDQQTALNLKANLASPALTGTPTAPTAPAGTNTTQLATTAFVTAVASNRADIVHGHTIADVFGLQAALDGKQEADEDLTAIASLAGPTGFLKRMGRGTWSLDNNTYLTDNKTITVSGDATGTGTTNIALTLANSGIPAGTYRSVTVDTKGRVTAGTNPTTLAGYGITDAVQATGSMTLTKALISTASLSTSTTAASQVVDTFAANTYRAAKYMVQASSGTAYQVVEVLMAHDGTSVFMTEYGSVTTGTNLVTLDSDISAGKVRLLATPTNATTTIRVVCTAIEV